MKATRIVIVLTFTVVVIFIVEDAMVESMSTTEKKELREKVLEMFNHAYGSYMQNAFPADELMPLSCKGRYRGTEPSRGDVDDSLGNFTLTLIDSLDTLVVLGELEQFDNAVRLVIQYAKFDSDVIVSVFETNIRILGGLLGGHVVASYLKRKKKAMEWYNEELLNMAKDVGYKLLPAFNTTTGIPYPRINLKYGMKKDNLADRHRDTCTACAGTMILEFAALTRLTGDPIFEEKAHKAMDYLWEQRHRTSDLVGTVINVHNGDWVRRESGVGAGIDSYYEYVLKAYVLLGDDRYLNRFNKHYTAIMKYISQGPMLVDVHMHKPNSASKNFMDALLAFWPGLQVLKGDIRPAIETHEMLYQVIQRHNFLPEAFTTDFRVHWGQHPLRPEFLESTYFLYKATGDPHYLQVGKHVLENLNTHARVPCGFASLKDVVSGKHEDQLDSYVLAETFKYLYLLFSEKSDLVLNIDDYIFTTEAHLLPLSLSVYNTTSKVPKINREVYRQMEEFTYDTYPEVEDNEEKETDDQVCPNPANLHRGVHHYAYNLRTEMKGMVDKANPQMASCQREKPRLKAVEFIAGNKAQLEMLNKMGIRIATMSDGRVQLLHSAADAATPLDAEDGMKFMQEMIELSKNQQQDNVQEPMTVQFISEPYWGSVHIRAGPAQFGYSLKINPPVQGQIAVAEPYSACSSIANPTLLEGKIAIVERGNCMFIDKARNIQNVGAIGGIVIDNNVDSTSESSPIFAMSGDGRQDVKIPMVFLFHKEGQDLLQALAETLALTVLLSQSPKEEGMFQPFYGADPAEPETKEPDSTVEVHGPNKLSENSGSGSSEHVSSTEQTSELPSEIDQNEWIKVKVNNQALNKDELVEEANGGMEYRLQAGTGTVQMDVKVSSKTSQEPKSPGVIDDDVIILKTLPDGSKELSFRFDKISKSVPKTKPELNQIYVDLVDILQRRTNFNSLGRPGDYLIAIARLLESAYFNLESVDREAQKMFDKLANELEIINPEVKDPEGQFNDNQSPEEAEDQTNYNFQKPITDADEGLPQNTKGEFQHYATPEELAGASSALPGQVPNIESETTVTFHDLTQSQENILTQENSINSFKSEKSESRAENSINTQKNGNYGTTNKNSEKTENQNRRSNDEL